MITLQLEPCCICNDKAPMFKCVQCRECLICIGCIQHLMEYGQASKCPVCRKEDNWCIPITKQAETKITICQCIYNIIFCKKLGLKCPNKKEVYEDFIRWKIIHEDKVKIVTRLLALIGIICVFYLIGIGWAKLYNGCITQCGSFYKNTIEHIFRGAFISFIFLLGSLLISRICYDCYKENIPCGCVINIFICSLWILNGCYMCTKKIILNGCSGLFNKRVKIQIENN